MPEVSVIVAVYNGSATLGSCLRALQQQDYPAENFEVIVVDNQSTDGTAELAGSFPNVRVATEQKRGAYYARNHGLQLARGRLIAFTDADCFPRPDWLRLLVAKMEDDRLQVVMGRDIPSGTGTAIKLLGEYDHFKEVFVLSSSNPDIYYGHTNCMITRRHLFDVLGPFDDRLRGADVIFVQKVLQEFGTESVSYQPLAVVDHSEVNSAWVYFKKAFIYGRSARSYQRVVSTRPLRNRERLGVYRQVVNTLDLPSMQSAYLFGLLIIGVLAYGLGYVFPQREQQK